MNFSPSAADPFVPQWNPAMKTGSTSGSSSDWSSGIASPQWNPAMKTGSTVLRHPDAVRAVAASMEPGHEDREHQVGGDPNVLALVASMEPGHEDREHTALPDTLARQDSARASMEPGHEDREHAMHIALDRHHPRIASMEPGHEDREHGQRLAASSGNISRPQWNPAMKTGSTRPRTITPCVDSPCLNGTRP